MLLLFLSCVLRLVVISKGDYYDVQKQQSIYKIDISKLRGTIYDCNMVPITNNETQKIAVITPNDNSINAISRLLDGDELDVTLKKLNNNQAAICNIDDDIFCNGIATATKYIRYGKSLQACHLIGYIDDNGHGVSGIELAYDDVLYSDEYLSANIVCDGKGNILKGIDPTFENDLSNVLSGVVTTIDINMQTIVENEVSKLNSGCAVVAEVKNGKIRAMASVPTFDINNLAQSLEQKNSPMINKALYCYNVGSVFKPCVAASVIENDLSDITFKCEGNLKIGDRYFKCHNLNGHGIMSLSSSLAQSCNCFFYNAALTLGGENIYKRASILNLGTKIKIADNLYARSGSMPTKNEVLNNGTIANLSIGQGKLMSSPVAVLNLYLAIAGNGEYYVPSVVEKIIKNGKESKYDIGNATRVMKSDTAKILREQLKTVITEGTGAEAAPTLVTAAGKTATAQTGRFYEDKTEITNSWFCGFFPADNPQYVIVVMSDSKLTVSTSSVFAKIADGIAEYKDINGNIDN